ncbi:MAG: DUF362 domain-containing protein [Deltaproteobacteria bacterium]|nr:DUF362 domain-containing protein [Deltaproteobacteria bacterium]
MSTVYCWRDLSDLQTGVNKFFAEIHKTMPGNKVGLKVHFGEEKNTTYIKPKYYEGIKQFYSEPCYVECNVLYRGARTTAASHLEVARSHGFTNLPIKILDGEDGLETHEVVVNQKNISTAKLGRGITEFDQLISVAHFKGHMLCGFGGAIKNVAMGIGSRTGKLEMHAGAAPIVSKKKCTACNACAENCDFKAITIDGDARINDELCANCARCIAVCPTSAINVNWGKLPPQIIMERICEYMLGAMQNKKWAFINFLTDITQECDCMNMVQKPLMADVGALMSFDPVAIDQASIDLLKEVKGEDPFFEQNKINSQYLLDYAQKLGLGSKTYTLEQLT